MFLSQYKVEQVFLTGWPPLLFTEIMSYIMFVQVNEKKKHFSMTSLYEKVYSITLIRAETTLNVNRKAITGFLFTAADGKF